MSELYMYQQRPSRKNQSSSVYVLAGFCIAAAALACYAWFPIPSVPNIVADKVIVQKSQHTMALFRAGQQICSYRVALGKNSDGPKHRNGDHKTPEGNYILDRRNPDSAFHFSIHVSYPNETDRATATKDGVSPGGDIMVHGIKNGFGWLGRLHRLVDWTDGCIALTDAEMDQFAKLVPDGTPIEIRP
jgi:murein L,D-transpeptidase YafK